MMPGFGRWVRDDVMPTAAGADFVNLQVVRAWGARVPGSPALRVSGEMRWPAWDGAPTPLRFGGGLRAPNLL
eukprot:2695995-Prymnesium_polylepis.2